MKKNNDRLVRAMMTSASIVALCAFAPNLVTAQTSLVGAPGQALTTGSIDSANGASGQINDGGVGGDVSVSSPANDTVTVTDATINSVSGGTGLSVLSTSNAPGALNVVLAGANDIRADGSAIFATSGAENVNLDASAGGSTYVGGSSVLRAYSLTGGISILNGGNVISGQQAGIDAYAAGASNVTIDSLGGTITSASGSGVSASSAGGDVVVGEGGGVTSAITSAGPGIVAATSGAGTIDVRTGSGGSIDGGNYGVYATSETGAINVAVGGGIGQITPTTGMAAYAQSSNGGAVTVDATSALSGSQGVYATTSHGAGAVTVSSRDVIASSGVAVEAEIYGADATGDILYTLNGASTVSGAYGVSVSNAGSGAISLTAADVGSHITSTVGSAIEAHGAGPIDINVAGTVSGAGRGVYATGAGGAINITTGAVTASNGRAIDVTSAGGAVSIHATGNLSGSTNGVIIAATGEGAITVLADGTVGGTNAAGININTTGHGAVSVGTATDRVGGAVNGGTTGLIATGSGDVSIYAGAVTGATRGVVAASQGSTPNGKVIIDVAGPVVGTTSYGVIGLNNGALAANTLSINTGGTVNATGGSGISAQANGGDITIVANDAVKADAAANGSWDAIFAEDYGAGNIGVTTHGTVTGSYLGIDLTAHDASLGGAITLIADHTVTGQTGVYAVSAGTAGVRATLTDVVGTNGAGVFVSGAGDVVIATGAVTSTDGAGLVLDGLSNATSVTLASGYGVAALSSGGNIDISASGLITGGAAGGVVAQSSGATGDVTIAVNDVVTTGRGIEVESANGAISIAAGAVNAGVDGVRARETGYGAVNLGTADAHMGAVIAGGTGLFATGAGDISIYSGAVSGGTRGIVASSQGATPDGVVLVNATGPVVAGNGGGVSGNNFGILASNTTTIETGAVTSTGGTGISGFSNGGDVTITAHGAVTADAGNGQFWDGVYGEADGENNIAVTTQAAVTGSYAGIEVLANYATTGGAITVNAADTVTGWFGVNAYSAGQAGVQLNLADIVATNGGGVFAQSAGDVHVATGAVTATGGGAVAIIDGVASGTSLSAGVDNGVFVIPGVGVSALSSGGSVAVDATGVVSGGAGILAQTGAGAISITSVGATATGGRAIEADSQTGSIQIASRGGAISATDIGILATTGGAGSVYIGGSNGISSAITSPVTGIMGSTVSGALKISTAATGTIAAGATTGIDAQSTSGAITINQAGSIGSAGAGNTVVTGIYAKIDSGSNDLTINSSGGIYVAGAGSAGIYAVNHGTGATIVTTSGVIDPGAYGVVVQGNGAVSYTASGGVVEGDIGAQISSTGAGGVTVNTGGNATVTGFTGAGLQVSSAGGDVSLTNNGSVVGKTDGVTLSTSGTGGVTLVASGTVVGQTGAGVSAIGGSGLTSVVVNGNVTGASTGVFASSTGTGSTVVTTTGSIAGVASPGITVVSGSGGLQLNVGGSVTSVDGPAINATSAGGGTINIAANSVVAGKITSADTAVINLATAEGSSSTLNVAAGAVVQSASGSVYDVAVRATGGSVVINNQGTLAGRIDFSALTGDNTGQLVSTANTNFETGGVSVFGEGDDNFGNAGKLITLGALTTFDFRGGTNVFNNSGTTYVGFSPVAVGGSRFLITQLTTLNNSGTLEMGNGVVGDSIVAAGAAYVGSGAALLSVDSQLKPGGASDTLAIGASSGVTKVKVHDTTTGFGALDPQGVLVVAGAVHAGDFVLDSGSSWYNASVFGGVLDKPGMFFSQLAVDSARGAVLVSAPKTQAYQFATLAAQAQTVWHDASDRSERNGDLRDRLTSTVKDQDVRTGFWFKLEGSRADRDVGQSFTALSNTYAYDAGYKQDVGSATVGFDGLRASAQGGLAYGVSVGYVDSDADFDRLGTSTKMHGVVLSGYASYVAGDTFLSATVAGDKLDAKLTAAQLAGFGRQGTDIDTVGGSLEAGLRKPFLFGAVIEPSMGLAYSNTSIDDVTAVGSTFRFDDAQSLRVSLGARVTGVLGGGDAWRTRYSFSARAVDERADGNDVAVINAGAPLSISDKVFNGPYGELKTGVSGQNTNGWSAYGDAKVRFNDRYTEAGVSLGVRFQY